MKMLFIVVIILLPLTALRGQSAAPSGVPEPTDLRAALVGYKWSWRDVPSYQKDGGWSQIEFHADGMLRGFVGNRAAGRRQWKLIDDHHVYVDRDIVLTFDQSFHSYTGKFGVAPHERASAGERLVAVGGGAPADIPPAPAADRPGAGAGNYFGSTNPNAPTVAAPVPASPVVNLPPGPMPSPVKPILIPKQLDPIVGRWRLGGSIIVFAQDGGFTNSAPHYFEKGTWSLASSSTIPTYRFNWSNGRKVEEFELSGNELKRLDKRKGWVTAGQRVD